MGMEFAARSSSPINLWLRLPNVRTTDGAGSVSVSGGGGGDSADASPTVGGKFAEFSASPTVGFEPAIGSVRPDGQPNAELARRAWSFPSVDPSLEPTSLKVRSQSESAALNCMNARVSRGGSGGGGGGVGPYHHEFEMCRQQWQRTASSCASSAAAAVAAGASPTTFFTPKSDIQSDSEGDDSLVCSSEEGGCSSADGIDITEHYDDEEDLGVVRDLELYDRDIDTNKSYRIQQQYLAAAAATAAVTANDSTTPLVGSPSSSSGFPVTAAAAAAAALGGKLLNEASINRLAILAAIQSKKAVRFADECGKCLETVRVMTEPSDYPPLVNPAVIRRFRKAALAAQAAVALGDSSASANSAGSSTSVIGGDEDDEDDEEALAALKAPRSSWKITFRQPASEYVKFRDTLEHQKVALENVMLKNDVGRMVGTIKVGNIAFEKRVFIRFTADGWKTSSDRPAVYQSSPSKSYDTFRFDVDIPRDTETNARIEFCVCFEANGGGDGNTYWDSNEGKNFVLTASDYDHLPSGSMPSAAVPIKAQPSAAAGGSPRDSDFAFGISPPNGDAYTMNYDNWTKFASWRNLKTDAPYW